MRANILEKWLQDQFTGWELFFPPLLYSLVICNWVVNKNKPYMLSSLKIVNRIWVLIYKYEWREDLKI